MRDEPFIMKMLISVFVVVAIFTAIISSQYADRWFKKSVKNLTFTTPNPYVRIYK